jgi:hypothetical protein
MRGVLRCDRTEDRLFDGECHLERKGHLTRMLEIIFIAPPAHYSPSFLGPIDTVPPPPILTLHFHRWPSMVLMLTVVVRYAPMQ